MSHQNASTKSILFAFLANLGIAITKTIAAVITGSGAMLAESIHSFADCGNQILLFVGIHLSKKENDEEHPLGYGKEIYFWSFMVAIILFSLGGMFSIYEGFHKINSHEGLESPFLAIIVIIISMFLEGASLYGCVSQINKIRNGQKFWKWIRNSRQSELIIVFGEDVAALFGLSFALLAVILSLATGNPIYDAFGSIAIGALLIIVSVLVAIKVKGLLIGQSSDSETRNRIRECLNSFDEIEEILNLITVQLGAKIMVAVKAKMQNVDSAEKLIEDINSCEARLKNENPDVQWIFFEPDNLD